ncbi:uncharacterized protein [Dysidea avara]|uniref:uncharacterized protein isoform X2 n=1 Tax=Dysidea avara TaxID=196820 RepID=UPI003329D3E5
MYISRDISFSFILKFVYKAADNMCTFTTLLALVLLASTVAGNVHLEVRNSRTGRCTTDTNTHYPFVRVEKEHRRKCDITTSQTTDSKTGLLCTDFVVKNLKHRCVIYCFIGSSQTSITIHESITDIISDAHNVTVPSGMPVTFNCTVKSSDYHQLLWMKGSVFVNADDNHSLWFSQRNNHTKTYYMTVHSAVDSAPYSCVLMSTSGTVVGSVTQYVFVKEADSMVLKVLGYVNQYFRWNAKDA